MKYYLIAFCLLGLLSCKQTTQKDADLVAKVNGYTLTKADLKGVVPTGMSKTDSVTFVKKYISQWATNKLMYAKAQVYLSQTNDIEQLVSNYRQQLYIDRYKEILVKEKLDSTAINSGINNFYNQNKESFKLGETLIKLKYIKTKSSDKLKSKLIGAVKSENTAEILYKLKDFKGFFYTNTSEWVSLDAIKNKYPNFPLTEDKLVAKKMFFEKSIDDELYIVQIVDVLKKGHIAPLIYVKPTIVALMLQNQKLDFFNRLEQNLIDDAKKAKEYEIY